MFEEYFEKTYGDINVRMKIGNISLIDANECITKATQDLQQFLRILYEATNMFYKLDRLKVGRQTTEGCLFNRDNMLNFITSIVFTGRIYDVVFKLYQLRNAPAERSFEKGLKKCQNFSPVEFGIPDEYSLDDKTVVFLKGRYGSPQIILDENQLQEFNVLDTSTFTKEKPLTKVSISKSELEMSKGRLEDENVEESKRANYGPKSIEKSYEKPIQMLKKLEHRRRPDS